MESIKLIPELLRINVILIATLMKINQQILQK